MRICRDYGRDLEWWRGLSRGDQALYWGEAQLCDEEQERAHNAALAAARRRR